MELTTILFTLKTLWKNKSVVLLVSLLSTLAIFYVYHNHISSKIESLERDNIVLQEELKTKEIIMKNMRDNYEKIIVSRDELVKEIKTSKEELEKLKDTLSRKDKGKKSLEELARKKTSLIEKRINKATKNVLECFEVLSSGGDC